MSGLHKSFKTDANKEIDGIEIPFEDAVNDDGTVPTFVISRMGKSNKAYTKALEAATRPHRRSMQLGTMKSEAADNIFMTVFVDTVLKGWKNVRNEQDEPIVFERQAAIALMKELPEVYERLVAEAGEASNFRQAALEEEAKN